MLTLYFVLHENLPQKTQKVYKENSHRNDQISIKCLISNPIKLSWEDVKESAYIFVT